ncbi:neuronal acetylcholine receptor subunit alpha-5-like [Anoplophora glabripennis]|uniref:neuronal acetylcholine receptor subunit alpha-5-like n=1 Tax=Anoplophora glabripennis TaxID=217634 RepID=UPI00087435AD|nr:neuronal acetylcholine receptor subunit alpha-5-like [Anoplophora glabripennis]
MCCVTRYIFSLLIIYIAHSEELLSDCPTSSLSTTYGKLKTAILCDYDAYIRPVSNHQNATAVYFKLILKYFTYDVIYSTLSLDAWMKVYWIDQHLVWNPDDYDNISSIYLETYDIWTPDLSIYNRAEQGGNPSAIGSTRCTVSNKGSVICVPSLHIDSLCVPDLRMYPYDSQVCALRVGSWVQKGEELDIKLLKEVVSQKAMEPNGEWEIESYTAKKYAGRYCCPNVTFPSIEIKFKINRLHGAHAASIIIPTVVVVILTFTSLVPSPVNTERLILCSINLIVQFLHVQNLSWLIPLKGDRIPFLILFARDSLLMSAIALVFTIIFKSLMQRQTLAPIWISTLVSYVIGCVPGRYLFLNDTSAKGVAAATGVEDGMNIISSDRKNPPDWEIFVKILDFILLISYIIAYFIMAVKFIPS